jgi:hypothetical protein
MQTDKLVGAVAVGVVAAAGLAAAWMTSRQDPADTALAAAGQVSVPANRKDVVTAPPLKAPQVAATEASAKAGPRSPANAMGAAPVCRNCGVVQNVVAVYGYGKHRAEAFQMHVRMDDGSQRTVQQRGALAAGSRVMVEGNTVRVLADRAPPG